MERKIVEIEWADSYGGGGTWVQRDEALGLEPSHILSVGYLIHRDKTKVIILQSITDVGDLVMGALVIPKGCVQSIKVIG